MQTIAAAQFSARLLKVSRQQLRCALVLFGCSIVMMWPAIYNGYPLLFSDSSNYIQIYHEMHLIDDAVLPRYFYYRSLMYALSVGFLHSNASLFAVIFLQSATLVAVIYMFFYEFRKEVACPLLLLTTSLLALATSAPWIVSWIMPDIFTSILSLSLIIIGLPSTSNFVSKLFLSTLSALSISIHASHILLGIFTVGLIIFINACYRSNAKHATKWLLASICSGLVLVLLVNFFVHKRITLAPQAGIFLFARLVEDGPAKKLLREQCPVFQWALCELSRPPEVQTFTTASRLVWDENSPINRLGGPSKVTTEAKEIVWRSFLTYPDAVLSAAARSTFFELIAMRIGGKYADFGAANLYWPRQVLSWVAPSEVSQLDKSRQAAGEFESMAWVKTLNLATTIFSILLTVLAAVFTKDPKLRYASFVLFSIWIVNAAICGSLSEVQDRYNVRVTWMFVLPCMLYIFELTERFVKNNASPLKYTSAPLG